MHTFWLTKHKTILFQTLIPNPISMLRLTKWWYLQNSLFIATIGSTAFLYCPHVGLFVYDDVFALSYSVCKLYKVDNEVKFVSFYDNIGLHVILYIYFLNFNSLVALTCTCVVHEWISIHILRTEIVIELDIKLNKWKKFYLKLYTKVLSFLFHYDLKLIYKHRSIFRAYGMDSLKYINMRLCIMDL